MNGPRITLAQVLEKFREQPVSPELELASIDFQELPHSEQLDILFKALCQQGAQIDWLLAQQLRK